MERRAAAAVLAFLSTNSHPLLLLRRYLGIHPEDIAESLLRRRSGIPGILADGSERSSTLFASPSRRETMTTTLTLGARGATETLASRGGEERDFRGDGYGKMGIHVDVARGVVMQVFHACERGMDVESREGKGGGNVNGWLRWGMTEWE